MIALTSLSLLLTAAGTFDPREGCDAGCDFAGCIIGHGALAWSAKYESSVEPVGGNCCTCVASSAVSAYAYTDAFFFGLDATQQSCEGIPACVGLVVWDEETDADSGVCPSVSAESSSSAACEARSVLVTSSANASAQGLCHSQSTESSGYHALVTFRWFESSTGIFPDCTDPLPEQCLGPISAVIRIVSIPRA